MNNVIKGRFGQAIDIENNGLGNFCQLAMKLNAMPGQERLNHLQRLGQANPCFTNLSLAKDAIRELWEAGARIQFFNAVTALASGARLSIIDFKSND